MKIKNFLYGLIYSLVFMELEMLKIYIKTHLKPGLFGSSQQFLLSYLINILTKDYGYALITKNIIFLLSKIDVFFLSLICF